MINVYDADPLAYAHAKEIAYRLTSELYPEGEQDAAVMGERILSYTAETLGLAAMSMALAVEQTSRESGRVVLAELLRRVEVEAKKALEVYFSTRTVAHPTFGSTPRGG